MCGAISDSANSRTLRRSCCCSSVKEKSTGPQGNSASYSAQFLYTTGRERAFLGNLGEVPKTHGLSSTGFKPVVHGALIPANLVPRILLVEPFLQRRKVIEDGGRIHLPLARQGFECVRPRAALAHRQHLGELRARGFISVDR